MFLVGDGTFVVSPSFGTGLLVALGILVLAGAVTAAKGRWGWLFIGVLFGGTIWPLTALLLTATPDSVWGRAFYGPEKMTRARKLFPRRLPYAQS